MEAWQNIHFNFDDFPKNIGVSCEWPEIEQMDLSEIEYLIIWHHKNSIKDLSNLPNIPKLKYLEINWSNSLSLEGLEKYNSLKRLEIHMCTKLESIEDISSLKNSLEYVHFNGCKKINNHEKIIACKKLDTLCFNKCGEIKSLDFILSLPNLKDFRFVNTNILDGNLNPIIEHPKLKSIGMLNKRNYSHKSRAIEKLLDNK